MSSLVPTQSLLQGFASQIPRSVHRGRGAGVREAAGRNSPGRAMVGAGLQLVLCSSQLLGEQSLCCTTATHHIMLWNWLFQVLKSDLLFHQTMPLIRGAV